MSGATRAEVICSPGDEGDGRADYWSTPSGAEPGEPAEAGPQGELEEIFRLELAEVEKSPEGSGAGRADRGEPYRYLSTEEARAIRIPHLVVLTSYIIVL